MGNYGELWVYYAEVWGIIGNYGKVWGDNGELWVFAGYSLGVFEVLGAFMFRPLLILVSVLFIFILSIYFHSFL